MKRRAAAALAAGAMTLGLAACAHHGPDLAACTSAIKAEYTYALAHPSAPAATEPAACKGIPAAQLQRILSQIIATTPLPGAAASTAGPASQLRTFAAQIMGQ